MTPPTNIQPPNVDFKTPKEWVLVAMLAGLQVGALGLGIVNEGVENLQPWWKVVCAAAWVGQVTFVIMMYVLLQDQMMRLSTRNKIIGALLLVLLAIPGRGRLCISFVTLFMCSGMPLVVMLPNRTHLVRLIPATEERLQFSLRWVCGMMLSFAVWGGVMRAGWAGSLTRLHWPIEFEAIISILFFLIAFLLAPVGVLWACMGKETSGWRLLILKWVTFTVALIAATNANEGRFQFQYLQIQIAAFVYVGFLVASFLLLRGLNFRVVYGRPAPK